MRRKRKGTQKTRNRIKKEGRDWDRDIDQILTVDESDDFELKNHRRQAESNGGERFSSERVGLAHKWLRIHNHKY